MKATYGVPTRIESSVPRYLTATRDFLLLLLASSFLAVVAVGCGKGSNNITDGAGWADLTPDGGQTEAYGAGGSGGTGGLSGISGSGGIGGSGVAGANVSGAGGSSATGGSGGEENAGGTGGSIATGGTGGEEVTGGTGGSIATGGTGGEEVTGGTGGTSATGGTGGSSSGSPDKPRCLTKGSQVVLIGDSYINWISHTFPADLNREAGQTFRNYAVGGYSMGSGGLGLIPPEWDQAYLADPDIIAAVMDGGGNDILIPDALQFPNGGQCKNSATSPTIPDCQKIVQKALDAATTLMKHAADQGLRDVVYFFYPHVPNGTLLGGTAPNAILDYALPKAKEVCDNSLTTTNGKLRCYFVDLIPVLDDANGNPVLANFAATDIHPNSTGSALMAKAVWAEMKKNCIAQPASSGCCAR